MNCPRCNSQIVRKGTFDKEAELVPSSARSVDIVSSRKHEKAVYLCSNIKCPNHDTLLNEDGIYFDIES